MNVGPADSGGGRVESDLWLEPGAAVRTAHGGYEPVEEHREPDPV